MEKRITKTEEGLASMQKVIVEKLDKSEARTHDMLEKIMAAQGGGGESGGGGKSRDRGRGRRRDDGKGRRSRESSNERIIELKKTTPCNACGVIGHWEGDSACPLTKDGSGEGNQKGPTVTNDRRPQPRDCAQLRNLDIAPLPVQTEAPSSSPVCPVIDTRSAGMAVAAVAPNSAAAERIEMRYGTTLVTVQSEADPKTSLDCNISFKGGSLSVNLTNVQCN